MNRKIPLDDLQEKARVMTRQALKEKEISEELYSENLFLEVKFEDNERVFELYQFGGSTPDKDFLIARTTLNVFTGEGNVEIFLHDK